MSESPETPATARIRWAWLLGLLVPVLIADLATKWWIFTLDRPLRSEAAFDIIHAWNLGAAWSMGASMPWVVTGLTLVLIPVLAVVWWTGYRHAGAWTTAGFGAVLGGALGNAYDRLGARLGFVAGPPGGGPGGVRDFLHVDLGFPPFDPWPTFNIADAGICVGFAIVVVASMLAGKHQHPA